MIKNKYKTWKEYYADYYKNNRERLKAVRRVYNEKNKEKIIKTAVEWNKKHKGLHQMRVAQTFLRAKQKIRNRLRRKHSPLLVR